MTNSLSLSSADLDQLFGKARSFNAWQKKDVPDLTVVLRPCRVQMLFPMRSMQEFDRLRKPSLIAIRFLTYLY